MKIATSISFLSEILSLNSVVLLELTFPLDSIHHLESAQDHKADYFQMLSELDR